MLDEHNTLKLVVKVAKQSKLEFSNSKVYRAITIEELDVVTRTQGCHIVVFENIEEDEQDAARKFIETFSTDANNHILFIDSGDNEITTGIADEYDGIICVNDRGLYKYIYEYTNTYVGIYMDEKRMYSELDVGVSNSMPDTMSELIGEISLAEEDAANKHLEEVQAEEQRLREEEEARRAEEAELARKEARQSQISREFTDVFKGHTESNTNRAFGSPQVNTSEDVSTYLDKIAELNKKLSDLEYKYNRTVKDAESATKLIKTMQEALKALKEERQAILERFNRLQSDVILENPISLDQYKGLEEERDDYQRQLEYANSKIETLTEEIESTRSDADTSVRKAREQLISVTNELTSLQEQIESGELNRELVEKQSEELARLETEKENLVSRVEKLNDQINDLSNEISDLKDERQYRVVMTDYLEKFFKQAKKVKDRYELDKSSLIRQITELKEQRDNDARIEQAKSESRVKDIESSLNGEIQKLKTDHEIEVASLKKQAESKEHELKSNFEAEIQRLKGQHEIEISSLKTRADLAGRDTQSQLEIQLQKATSELNDSNTRVTSLEEQLRLSKDNASSLQGKLNQCQQELAEIISSSAEARTLIERNKSLEEQLSTSNQTLRQVNSSIKELDDQNKEYRLTISGLEQRLKAYQSSSGNGYVTGIAKTIEMAYKGKAKIIPVYGAGSYGVTTTAISIAEKLCIQNKTLFLDMDFDYPKGDVALSTSPVSTGIPGINPRDLGSTALALTLEHGTSFAVKHYGNLVKRVKKSKYGYLDYFSGVYKIMDEDVITNFDYNSFFDVLGRAYDFIVVDLGKLGGGGISNKLIKGISNVPGVHGAAVVNSTYAGVRNFLIRMGQIGISVLDEVIVINRCESTNLDQRIGNLLSQYQGNVNYVQFFEQRSSGNSGVLKFGEDNMNKVRLENLLQCVTQ